MTKMRGQAFETMMLVIGVIVAVVILGLLLGILTRIQPPGADAKTAMINELRDVQNKGAGFSDVQRTTLKVGLYDIAEIVVNLPISRSDVRFALTDNLKSSGAVAVSGDGDSRLRADKDLTVFIVTCKPKSKYVIMMGTENEQTSVSDACDKVAS